MINWYRTLPVGFLLAVLLISPLAVKAYECQPLELAHQDSRNDIRHEHGLLWRISKGGVEPSYLFGTIHVSDPEIVNLPTAVKEALQESELFVMEARLDGPEMLAFAQEMFFRDGTRLSDIIDTELYQQTETLLAKYGIPPMAAQSLKPWAAFMTLNMPPDVGLPLDLVLKNLAQEHGLKIDGLESVAEQAAVFENLSRQTQIELLSDSVCHYDVLQGDMDDMKKLYLQRDLEGLFSYHNKYHLQTHEEYQQLMKRLLWDRNRIMAERMLPILEKGNAFIAIGAMHLAGEQGVLSLLEDSGYQVKSVY